MSLDNMLFALILALASSVANAHSGDEYPSPPPPPKPNAPQAG
jgi:hypothetical protein